MAKRRAKRRAKKESPPTKKFGGKTYSKESFTAYTRKKGEVIDRRKKYYSSRGYSYRTVKDPKLKRTYWLYVRKR